MVHMYAVDPFSIMSDKVHFAGSEVHHKHIFHMILNLCMVFYDGLGKHIMILDAIWWNSIFSTPVQIPILRGIACNILHMLANSNCLPNLRNSFVYTDIKNSLSTKTYTMSIILCNFVKYSLIALYKEHGFILAHVILCPKYALLLSKPRERTMSYDQFQSKDHHNEENPQSTTKMPGNPKF